MIGICPRYTHVPQMLLMQVMVRGWKPSCIRAMVLCCDWWRETESRRQISGESIPPNDRGVSIPRVPKTPTARTHLTTTTHRRSVTNDRYQSRVDLHTLYKLLTRQRSHRHHQPEAARNTIYTSRIRPISAPHANPPQTTADNAIDCGHCQGQPQVPSSLPLRRLPRLRPNAPLNRRDPRGHSQVLSASHSRDLSLDTSLFTGDL